MIVALVPLRGGSKSIPGKNIKAIAGRPLCSWALDAAYESGVFDKIFVSTDSEEIADVVRGLDNPSEVVMRPAELATDEASTESVMLHFASLYEFDTLCTIQATSPLVRPVDFVEASNLFRRERADSLLTGVRVKDFFWSDDGVSLNYDPLSRPRRQEFSGVIKENGAFYLTNRQILENTRCRLGGKICIYEMPQETYLEIDEPSDWVAIERLLYQRLR